MLKSVFENVQKIIFDVSRVNEEENNLLKRFFFKHFCLEEEILGDEFEDFSETKCEDCGKEFTNKNNLRSHRVRIHPKDEEKIFKCTICPKSFAKWGLLNKHLIQGHNTQNRRWACDKCPSVFHTGSSFREHKRVHNGNLVKCPHCPKTFVYKKHMTAHVKSIHLDDSEKTFICHICAKPFATQYLLTVHIKNNKDHNSGTRETCEICNKGFPDAHKLNRHMLIHNGDKPFVCEICSTAFNRNSNLKVHMRIHTGEKPHKCELCGKAFSDKGNYNKHMKNHKGFS